ncbi:MAG: hypothetical protein JSW39_14525 [Desulfobacterales bacterium]|nr:MAG: hypothetical protein JSW39_14525 [Desulfobacterales bacterium]
MGHYEIINEEDQRVTLDILARFYGNLWRSVLDRLNHTYDGYVLTIHDRNCAFRIYRILTR